MVVDSMDESHQPKHSQLHKIQKRRLKAEICPDQLIEPIEQIRANSSKSVQVEDTNKIMIAVS